MSVVELPPLAASGLAAALDSVEGLDPDRLSWVEQERLVRELDVAQRRLAALRLRALEAFVRGGGWQDDQHISPAAWVRAELGASRGDAGRDLSLARALRDWPAVQGRLAAGRISPRHAAALCSALTRLPEPDEPTVTAVLDLAELCDPLELARMLAARVAAAAPEQAHRDADRVHDRRGLHHSLTTDDMGRIDGWLAPELAELFGDALDAETLKDRAAHDTRTAAQRRHDAFGRLIRRAVQAPDAPKRHGQPVQLLVLIDADGTARTGGGHPLTRGAVDRLSCSSPLARCLRAGSIPLELGRTVRTATDAQYRALVVRDGGCAVRGCDRPAAWCSPHHLIPWQHGGTTDLPNLVLLCQAHHHALHDRDRHLPLRDGRTLTATGALPPPDPPQRE